MLEPWLGMVLIICFVSLAYIGYLILRYQYHYVGKKFYMHNRLYIITRNCGYKEYEVSLVGSSIVQNSKKTVSMHSLDNNSLTISQYKRLKMRTENITSKEFNEWQKAQIQSVKDEELLDKVK